jgi:hypothetical protein
MIAVAAVIRAGRVGHIEQIVDHVTVGGVGRGDDAVGDQLVVGVDGQVRL